MTSNNNELDSLKAYLGKTAEIQQMHSGALDLLANNQLDFAERISKVLEALQTDKRRLINYAKQLAKAQHSVDRTLIQVNKTLSTAQKELKLTREMVVRISRIQQEPN